MHDLPLCTSFRFKICMISPYVHHLDLRYTLSVHKNNVRLVYVVVKAVYKSHWQEPENVAFMSSCPLYTG
jgi:hypothetical protein